MITADFFSRMGLFVIPNFLSHEVCDKLRSAVASAEWKPATVAERSQDSYDERYRKTKQHTIDNGSKNEIHSRLSSIRPQLETHFKVALTRCQSPVVLSYSVGDFFRAHVDGGDDPDLPETIRGRKVSAVVFINRDAEEGPDTFSGGALVFYGLFPGDPRLKTTGFPLQAEEGLLIAFSSRMMHEVQPVTRGTRYSIVTWYS
jgi:predicted 2-oxoglutarate/Fe(II)-dependent dioxygenase YbiX